jgi:site-specific DNA recombinase
MGQRVVIYTRVSKDDTGEGRSNDRQASDCRKLAELRGWDVVAELGDISISAYTGVTRPQWQNVIQMALSGQVDIILAWHLDRITRSMVELEALINLAEQTGVAVVTVSGDIDLTNDAGRMVARILAAVARAEVERKSSRQRLANKQRAGQGKMYETGPRPFGYQDDRATINEPEAELLRQAARDFLEGESLHGIQRRWEELGVVSTIQGRDKPTPYSVNGIKYMLSNPIYAGKREYDGELYEGSWEPIFDDETHLEIVGKLNMRARPGKPKPALTLLSGIARCSVCGRELRADRQRDTFIYRCWEGHCRVNREQADNLVDAFAVAYLEKPEVIRHLAPVDSDELEELMNEADRLRLRAQELSDALDEDALTMSQFVDLNSRTLRKLEDIQSEIVRISTDSTISRFSVGTDRLAEQWLDASVKSKRDVIDSVFTVTLSPPPDRKRNVPVEQRVSIEVKQ